MRVRKKLIVLHTAFTLALAAILLVALGPALSRVVSEAEIDKARSVTAMVSDAGEATPSGVRLYRGSEAERLLSEQTLSVVRGQAGDVVPLGRVVNPDTGEEMTRAALWRGDAAAGALGTAGTLVVVDVRAPEARRASLRLFSLVVAVLLAVYLLVAAALELLVLPGALYAPIERLLRADRAVQDQRPREELIPESEIPSDEFGAIMRSRNASVLALRASERRLAAALEDLERVAEELKRKNHLLETARRNLEGADRLASLGMMSAGIAHELNTPLTVLKGLTDRLAERPGHRATVEESALMQRVVGRLERLGESLLDFARVREPRAERVRLESVVSEAVTLVQLDREHAGVRIVNAVPAPLLVMGDQDRLIQVFINLVRNAVDAVDAVSVDRANERTVRIAASIEPEEGGGSWVVARVEDSGPGLDPEVIPRLFEPFFSTRLDARGTGLGLAVAEGIVREHGGVLVGRNREDGTGAVFEITLPAGDRAHPEPGGPEASE